MLSRDRAIVFLATGCGCGWIPKAPGTFGSLATLPLSMWVSRCALPYALVGVSLFCVAAVLIAHRASALMANSDPGPVVIDEIAGMLAACIGLKLSILGGVAVFGLFRLFDILKPFPVGWLDRRLKGGVGIVADDVAAGVLVNLICRFGYWALG
jgi:phosphatidylglycerophosphatase A